MASWVKSGGRGAPSPLQSPSSLRPPSREAAPDALEDSHEPPAGGRTNQNQKDQNQKDQNQKDQNQNGHQPRHANPGHADPGHADPGSDHQLSDYRQKLAREMSDRVQMQASPLVHSPMKHPSPIEEEKTSAPASPAPLAVAVSPVPPPVPSARLSGGLSGGRPPGPPSGPSPSPPSVPASAPTTGSSGTTTSTDSARTVVHAGEANPGVSSHTPSYPFPRMGTPGSALPPSSFLPTAAWLAHARSAGLSPRPDGKAAAAASPTQTRPDPRRSASAVSIAPSERVLSTPSTPASSMAFSFQPSHREAREPGDGARSPAAGSPRPNGADLPCPNVYDLVLALSAEPGLDAWWNTVIEIATHWLRAERVALTVPSDPTDVENMPWGQKAIFNSHERDDDLSLAYLGPDGSSHGAAGSAADVSSDVNTPLFAAPSSTSGILSPPVPLASPGPSVRRPSLASRYSYTAYEDQKEHSGLKEPGASELRPHGLTKPPLNAAAALRPSLVRCQTSQHLPTQRSDIPKADAPSGMLPPKLFASLNHAALEEHDAAEGGPLPLPLKAAGVPQAGASFPPVPPDVRGRVLPVLQALDYEADPLIDHNGVQRVLDRGHAVALTRSYPYTEQPDGTQQQQQQQQPSQGEDRLPSAGAKSVQAQTAAGAGYARTQHEFAKLSSLLGNSGQTSAKGTGSTRPSASYMRRLTGGSVASKLEEAAPPRARSPLYEEYEQLPPSPWSRSPAPSPAVRQDPNENPFFSSAAAVVDEDCFNPDLSPEENASTQTQPVEAIGLDNAWTVLHIPLFHPLLSKPSSSFKLDKSKMERRSPPRRRAADEGDSGRKPASSPEASPSRPKRMPIAILSILSPIIPYPSALRHSIDHLAPHLASTFSLCVHYSNLEAEISGLHRRRHELGGFGGVDPEGHPLPTTPAFANVPFLGADDPAAYPSHTGSLTSYSDYSVRSFAGSPAGTPSWDSAALGMYLERRANAATATGGISPGVASFGGDGYFGMKTNTLSSGALGRSATVAASTPGGASSNGSGQRGRRNSVPYSKEKRMSALRLADVPLPAQEEQRTSSPAAAGPPLSVAITEAMSGSALGSSAENRPGSASSRSGHLTPASVADTPFLPPPPPTEQNTNNASADKEAPGAGLRAAPAHPISGATQPSPRHPRFQHQHSHSHGGHSQLHSYGADFASTFPSLPPSGTIAVKGGGASAAAMMLPTPPAPPPAPSRAASVVSTSPVDMPPPSDRLKSLMLDALPAHVFVAMPQTGAIVWVNSRYLAYRGQTVEGLAEDPWGSLHPEDRDEYLKAWSHSVRTGDQFSRTVRIRRFDGSYRWFQARAVASRDRRNTIMQFLGSYMDIHDQHIAELKAARQEEIEASETKHRILANLIPQIIFTANEEEGITFANEQWLSYTGQTFEDLLGLGFLDNVHPDDLSKCSFLPVPAHLQERRKRLMKSAGASQSSSPSPSHGGKPRPHPVKKESGDSDSSATSRTSGTTGTSGTSGTSGNCSGHSGDSGNTSELSELAELARRGVIMVTTDSNGRPSYTTEVRLRSKSGDYRWHLVRCVETGTVDFGRGYNSYFGSATDINDHKLLETKLKEAMESKTRFLSNMSHEIRTPLIGISGMVSFLQDTTLDEEQRDYTNTIQTSANSLLMIINDILDLSKVDAGMMKLSYEWFHTRSLIEDVNELVSTMAIAKGLELNYIVEADVPSWVKGDRVRIRQVLLNVIGNAIKFTAQGEVFSSCRVVERSSSRPGGKSGGGADSSASTPSAAPLPLSPPHQIELEFSVTDTGRGFTTEEAELIFKPFSQIDGSSTRQHGGSGLGLVISRQLVELHGGHMEGRAEPGRGSTFTFTAVFGLPTETDHPDGLATPSREQNMSLNTNMSLLGPSKDTLTAMGLAKTSFMDPAAVIAAAAASAAGVGAAGLAGVTSAASAASAASDTSDTSTDTAGAARQPEAGRTSFKKKPPSSLSVSTRRLARFGEAARVSGQDLAQMRFQVPTSSSSSVAGGSIGGGGGGGGATDGVSPGKAPPAFSILIICPQMHSREATAKHIETTLPDDRPHRITAVATMAEAQKLIDGQEAEDGTRLEPFTHVVVNLPSPQEILELVDQLDGSAMLAQARVLVLSDSVQRQAVNRLAAGTRYEERLSEARVQYVYKPVKPSRFAVIFDPERALDLSIDRNRSSAQRLVETQKQSYVDLEQRMGHQGHRVLLVEDNMVNQKVLTKYLQKVGVDVDVAVDGVECTDVVLSRPHDYYSLILCDLHMPRKDGYQACREIRAWEAAEGAGKAIPIIALSANVMSDVHDKCVEAGFSKYITKPVDFIVLSRALAEFF